MVFNNNPNDKIHHIKAFLLDVDGVLTDGSIIYDNNGLELKKFNVKDGQIISFLQDLNFNIGIITGRNSKIVEKRCKELKIEFYKQGVKNKNTEYQEFKKTYNLNDENIIYIGDDIIDLTILAKCGISVTTNDAKYYMKDNVDIITSAKGGEGVFREVADYILEKQNLLSHIIQSSKS